VDGTETKNGRSLSIPLNATAQAVLQVQQGKHPERVFTYRGAPLQRANCRAWRKALTRAGIDNFRFHDLRHTWASWHVQAGTSLYLLQKLGGWESLEMVQRYAHLVSCNLMQTAANAVVPRHNLDTVEV